MPTHMVMMDKATWEAQQTRLAALEAQVAQLREIAGEMVLGWQGHNETDSPKTSGNYCHHCIEYFEPDDHSVPARGHGDKCPVARLQREGGE